MELCEWTPLTEQSIRHWSLQQYESSKRLSTDAKSDSIQEAVVSMQGFPSQGLPPVHRSMQMSGPVDHFSSVRMLLNHSPRDT